MTCLCDKLKLGDDFSLNNLSLLAEDEKGTEVLAFAKTLVFQNQ